jgi:hypothetical protein
MEPRPPEPPPDPKEPHPTPAGPEPTPDEPTPEDTRPGTPAPASAAWGSGEPAAGPAAAVGPMPPPPGGGIDVPAPPAERPRRGRWLALAIVFAIVAAGGGAAAAFLATRGSDAKVLTLIPSSSDVVVTAELDPAASQKLNLFRLAHAFPALADDQKLGSQVDDALDQALEGVGLDHSDLQGWLGGEVAVSVDFNPDHPDGAAVVVLVASTDDGKATDTMHTALAHDGAVSEQDYRGVTIQDGQQAAFAVVDHVVAISDDPATIRRTIDTAQGQIPDLAEDATYLETVRSLPKSRLGTLYVNPADFVNALGALPLGGTSGAGGLGTLEAMRSIGVSLAAEPDGFSIDSTLLLDPSKLDQTTRDQLDAPVHPNAALAYVPSHAFAVASQENADDTLRQAVDQALATGQGEKLRSKLGLDDAIDALTGDSVLEIGPGTAVVPVGGALVLGVKDAAPVRHTLDGLANLALRETSSPLGTASVRQNAIPGFSPPRPAWKTTTYHGVSIRYLQDPSIADAGFLPAYAVMDGAAVIASNPAEIRLIVDTKASGEDITSSDTYTRALARVPSGSSSFYVDVAGIVADVGAFLPPDVKANVEPVRTIVAGSEDSSTRTTARVFIEIRPS